MFFVHTILGKIVVIAVIDAAAITVVVAAIETPAIVAICGVFVALFTVCGSIFTGIVTLRTQKILVDQTTILQGVKTNTDGLATAAAESAKKQGLAEGKAEEQEVGRIRALDVAAGVESDKADRAVSDIADAEARTPS